MRLTSCDVLHTDVQHGIVESSAHKKFEREVCKMVSDLITWGYVDQLTVDTLLIGKSLPLLRFVPLDDQAVTECQCCTCIDGAVARINICS